LVRAKEKGTAEVLGRVFFACVKELETGGKAFDFDLGLRGQVSFVVRKRGSGPSDMTEFYSCTDRHNVFLGTTAMARMHERARMRHGTLNW